MITPRISNKTTICEQAPNHGSYFAYARLIAVIDIFKRRCIAGNPIASRVAVISLPFDPISKIYEFFITQANAFAVRSHGSLK